MGIQKLTPKTDESRAAVLDNSKARKDGVLPADVVFSTANAAALDLEQALFKSKFNLLNIAQENYHGCVSVYDKLLLKIKNRASHGIQLVNMQVNDEIPGWPIEIRSYYNVPLSGKLPIIKNEQDIINLANSFITGETDRVAAGGVALVDISKPEIQSMLAELNIKLLARQASKNALQDAIKEMIKRRKAADLLITALWGDVEHASLNLPAGSRRDFSITWGVIYKNIKDIATMFVKVVDTDSGIIVRGANLSMGPLNGKRRTIAITNDYGVATIETRIFTSTYLISENPNYETESLQIELSAGEERTILIKMKYKAII